MSEHLAREVAVKLREGEGKRFRNRTRQILDDGGRLRLGGGGKTGVLQPDYGGNTNPIPPPYAYLVDDDGAYLVDSDGAYLFEYL